MIGVALSMLAVGVIVVLVGWLVPWEAELSLCGGWHITLFPLGVGVAAWIVAGIALVAGVVRRAVRTPRSP